MLNEIIFRGFKSFADEQVMRFEKGTNGIIGPNGCGKSNIIDGISFVLGAQSAKNLRGGKMQDVIFAGSDSRKPKDQAEVTLILDNEEGAFKKAAGKQIAVTRRVFRSGGSEYFIDNEPARLKDVHDLFMDTGVGSDSYSIIGQGQIGKILSTKLDERRAIFEEAAGIVKLKQQKEQTEKRLRDIEGNMVRIEDIVKELEKQLKPLERQAEKATTYATLETELHTLEVQYLVHEYDELTKTITDVHATVFSLSEDIASLSTALAENEERLHATKMTYQEQNDALFTFQTQVADMTESLEKINGSCLLNEERIENAKKRKQEAEEQIQEIESQHSSTSEDAKEKQQRLTTIMTTVIANEKEIAQMNETLHELDNQKLFLTNEIEHTRKKSVQAYNEMNQTKYEIEQIQKGIADTAIQLKTLEAKYRQVTEEKSQMEAELSMQKTRMNEHALALHAQEELLASKLNTVKELKRKQLENAQKVQETEREHTRIQQQIDHLEQFMENNEGFYDGVKAVLKEKKEGRITGIYGAVAEMIEVDKQYEVALDTLLQSSMQHLLVENDRVAKQCIEYLKREKKGKATFLPLNLANPYRFDTKDQQTISSYQGIRLAVDVVSYKPTFAPVMESLLGRSLVADTLDIALSFVKEKSIRAKIVTIDGEVVQAGAMSGGQSKHQKTSFFTKRRSLEEAKTQLERMSRQLDTHQSLYRTVTNQLQTEEARIETLQETIDDMRQTHHQHQLAYDTQHHALQRMEEDVQDVAVSQQELKLNQQEAKKTCMQRSLVLETTEKDYETLNASLATLSQSLEEQSATYEELKEEKTALIVTTSRLSEEEKQIKATLEDLHQDHDTIEDKIKKLYGQKEAETQRIEELSSHKEGLLSEQTRLRTQLTDCQSQIETMRAKTQQLQKEMDEVEQQVKQHRTQKEEQEQLLHKEQVLLSKKETEKTNTLLRLKETYALEEEQISSIERKTIDRETSKKTILSLKKEINALGTINHNAVEEFDTLQTRYKEENKQLHDVKTAKADLHVLLTRVEEEMVQRFTETFDAVATKFAETFVELFEGGKAKLVLENPKEPLTSAIEIIAQPPGKKPASINLLSGGEKSFTAVALIFAIISSKPSPFVILDEVDAPLDDANVIRFAKQLMRYKGMSQFVVITHRKGTMMACDTITGITQEERGVSIVFPHTLEDKEQLLYG